MARSLFTFGNPKTAKGESLGYLTAVLHLAPAESAGVVNAAGAPVTVCPYASRECIALCLNTAGRGGMYRAGETWNTVQDARVAKTHALFADRAAFLDVLRHDVRAAQRKAQRLGLKLAVRLNGTSDLPFLPLTLAREFPSTTFYDYTKVPSTLQRDLPPNYHVTFSRSESNAAHVFQALKSGANVAVVFSTRKGQPLPATYLGRRVIDGDTHDLRFLDPKGVVVGLRAKGRAKKLCGGFVVNASALDA